MDVAVVLLGEVLTAMFAFVGLLFLMDLHDVLKDIRFLSKSFVAAWPWALERLLLGVRAQVYQEFRSVLQDLVAFVVKLALEESADLFVV